MCCTCKNLRFCQLLVLHTSTFTTTVGSVGQETTLGSGSSEFLHDASSGVTVLTGQILPSSTNFASCSFHVHQAFTRPSSLAIYHQYSNFVKMNSLYSTYNYNACLDRISIDRRIEPISKVATLRLSKQSIPTATNATVDATAAQVQTSTDQYLMEVHVDGRLLVRRTGFAHLVKSWLTYSKARWNLNQLTRRTPGAVPGLIARSFSSFRLERIIQLVLPLPMLDEEERPPSASQTNPVCQQHIQTRRVISIDYI